MEVIRGKVRHGDKRGRTIGYPTANVDLHRAVKPGVYAAATKVRGKWRPSMAFIGAAKTFGNTQKRAESHVLDFSGNIYDDMVSIRLLHFIRPNKKFTGPKQLVKAIQKDEKQIRAYFEENNEYID